MTEMNDKRGPPTYEQIQNIVKLIEGKTKHHPKVAIVCGSGLGGITDAVKNKDIIKYCDIPCFPVSTVSGHVGQLVFGEINGTEVVVMQGRCHVYEGYPVWQVVVPIRTFHLMGVQVFLVTNAAGAINSTFRAGDVMLIKDHISFAMFAGHNPLTGPNDERFGPRFPAMSDAYDKTLRILAFEVAKELGLEYFREGVYTMLTGPTYETVAECRLLRLLGCDATGMSTVPEVVAARHCGMRVVGMSLISNKVVHDYDLSEAANHEEVLETARSRAKDLVEFLKVYIARLQL